MGEYTAPPVSYQVFIVFIFQLLRNGQPGKELRRGDFWFFHLMP
jgi:hypothetical protein